MKKGRKLKTWKRVHYPSWEAKVVASELVMARGVVIVKNALASTSRTAPTRKECYLKLDALLSLRKMLLKDLGRYSDTKTKVDSKRKWDADDLSRQAKAMLEELERDGKYYPQGVEIFRRSGFKSANLVYNKDNTL